MLNIKEGEKGLFLFERIFRNNKNIHCILLLLPLFFVLVSFRVDSSLENPEINRHKKIARE